MKQITNLTMRPVHLGDGTILAAARTEGSVKQVESLSDVDSRRLGDSISVSDVDASGNAGKDAGRTARTDAGAPKTEETK